MVPGQHLPGADRHLRTVLVFFHGIIGGSWAWSIIALTLVVRALLLPLAFKQMHSMLKLQQARRR
jgi:membrane protein insertase Oxa1/YidC/SpoIIIJ